MLLLNIGRIRRLSGHSDCPSRFVSEHDFGQLFARNAFQTGAHLRFQCLRACSLILLSAVFADANERREPACKDRSCLSIDVQVSFAKFLPAFGMPDLDKVHGNIRQHASGDFSRGFHPILPMNILSSDPERHARFVHSVTDKLQRRKRGNHKEIMPREIQFAHQRDEFRDELTRFVFVLCIFQFVPRWNFMSLSS